MKYYRKRSWRSTAMAVVGYSLIMTGCSTSSEGAAEPQTSTTTNPSTTVVPLAATVDPSRVDDLETRLADLEAENDALEERVDKLESSPPVSVEPPDAEIELVATAEDENHHNLPRDWDTNFPFPTLGFDSLAYTTGVTEDGNYTIETSVPVPRMKLVEFYERELEKRGYEFEALDRGPGRTYEIALPAGGEQQQFSILIDPLDRELSRLAIMLVWYG